MHFAYELHLKDFNFIKSYIKTIVLPYLDPHQFTYQANRSTDPLATALHTVLDHLEHWNLYVKMLCIDYSFTFSTITHGKLFSKLYKSDFLTSCIQTVKYSQCTSSVLILITRSPGLCAEPPIYTTYNNDCLCTCVSNTAIKFVDEAVLHYTTALHNNDAGQW